MAERTDPADFVNTVLSASELNELARGEIVNVELTSNSSGTTTVETILTETFTLTDARRVRFYGTATMRSNITGGASLRLVLDGTQINRKNTDALAAGTDLFVTLFKSKNLAAGSHTIDLVSGISGSDGNTVTAIANGETGTHGVCVLSADDCGPSYS